MSTPALFYLLGVMLLVEPAFAAETPPPAVLVEAAELRSLARQRDFVGRVESLEKVELRARVTGQLGPRRFQDGDKVKTGQVLFEIERAPYEATVAQREAQVLQAQAAQANAEQQLRRAKALVKTKAISDAEVDRLTADELRAAGQVKEAKAALDLARINLSYTTIVSPIDGRIGRANVTPGNLVGPDSGVLATIVRDEEVRILFPVSQKEILEARRNGFKGGNSTVFVKLADGTFLKDLGQLDFLDVIVDPRTDGQIVRATVQNHDHLLTDGQTLRVMVEQPAATRVVAVPQVAVASDQAGPYVFVVNDKNQIERRPVKVTDQREGYIAVSEGVNAGERVVVQGQQRVKPGLTVTPQMAPRATK